MESKITKIAKIVANIILFAAIFFGIMMLGYNIIYMPIFTIAMIVMAMFCVGMAIYIMTTKIN